MANGQYANGNNEQYGAVPGLRVRDFLFGHSLLIAHIRPALSVEQ